MIDSIFTLLSVMAPLALMFSLWVMAQISRRFGEVTHRPPYYRGFYVAMVMMLGPLAVRLLATGLGTDDGNELGGDTLWTLLHNLPQALGFTLASVLAWRYWGWLVYTREGDTQASRPVSNNTPTAEK
jgi:hypothetical protein